MSQLNQALNKTKAGKIYYDVSVSNLNSSTVKPTPFAFVDTRTVPFLSVPEEYEMSIVRFSTGTQSLPLFIPVIQPNQGNRDLTVYSVTLQYQGYVFQQFVQWNSQDNSAEIPPAPNQTSTLRQSNETGYYNCYSYSYFIEAVYEAFVACFNALDVIVLAATGLPLPSIYPPVISWDATTNSANLYAEALFYDSNPLVVANPIEIYMNAPLFSLFNSFPATYLGYNVLNGKNYRIPVVDIGGTNCVNLIPPGQPTPPPNYTTYRAISWSQEYSTTASWSPILSVVFTSNTLPIEPNQVSTPIIFVNNQNINLAGNNSDFANIITDIISSDGNYRPNLVYNPSAEYRRITLKGNRPLYSIDINIYYKLITGELIPLRLFSGESLTMKIVFEKII